MCGLLHPVGGNDGDSQIVCRGKLGRFRGSCAGHTRQLWVAPEEVLCHPANKRWQRNRESRKVVKGTNRSVTRGLLSYSRRPELGSSRNSYSSQTKWECDEVRDLSIVKDSMNPTIE